VGRDQKAGGKVHARDGSGEWTKKPARARPHRAQHGRALAALFDAGENGVVKKLNIEAPGSTR